MGLFGKKGKTREELIAEAAELNEAPEEDVKKDEVSTGDQKVDIELTKIKGRLEGLDEVRKASSERFSRVSEQIGELRGMIVDTNKAMSKVEVSSTKAVDLVESVHPEKLMIDVRKQDGKVEALRANIESNEAIMKDLMLELKKMRDKMSFYKGIEQVIQLNEEIKQELSTIKRVEATIEQHADKVETIFVEVEKKFSDFDKFNDVTKDLDKSFKRMQSDFEKVRTKVELKLDRKEFVDLLDRFNEFEKHTTNLLKLIDERNKTAKDELELQFQRLILQYRNKLEEMRPPTEPLPPKEEEPESGEDTAGADVRPGLMSKLKGMFKKEEVDEGDAMFPEKAEEIELKEEAAKQVKQELDTTTGDEKQPEQAAPPPDDAVEGKAVDDKIAAAKKEQEKVAEAEKPEEKKKEPEQKDAEKPEAPVERDISEDAQTEEKPAEPEKKTPEETPPEKPAEEEKPEEKPTEEQSSEEKK